MPCPLFFPIEPLDRGDWVHAPRLPLGDPYRGTCQANPAEPFDPPESEQRELCNCGYARGRCGRIPSDAPDAIRFSITHDASDRVHLIWVIEKDHAPVEFGTLASVEESLSIAPPLLGAQARAFLRSCGVVGQPHVVAARF